ncbi:MAG: hypothetical protein R3C49_03055 [Planctomycetaceae bacterium]
MADNWHNPFAAPEAEPTGPPGASNADRLPSPLWGVFAAAVFDLVGTVVAGVGVGLVLGVVLVLGDYPLDKFPALIQSSTIMLVSTVVGLGVSVFAGRLCIRLTHGRSLSYAGFSGVLATSIAGILQFAASEIRNVALVVLALAATPCAHVLGGYWGLKRREAAARTQRHAMVECSSPNCSVQFQATRRTCPVCGNVRQ